MVVGDAVDHLLDEHRLADTGTTEQTDLSTLDVRGEKVDDLDAGSNISVFDSSSSKRGALRWMVQRSPSYFSSEFSTSPRVLKTSPSASHRPGR